jgi:transcriptional regulator with XRE-family HTH domain
MPAKPNESATPVDAHVGKMIRSIRKAKNVSQETLAAALGVTFQQVQKYELGANRISASKMFDAAAFLEVPPAAFFEGLEGGVGSAFPPLFTDFFAEDGASTVAECYLKISPAQRRAVATLLQSMAE